MVHLSFISAEEKDELFTRTMHLYERWGKPLEEKHMGEYIAISIDEDVFGTDQQPIVMGKDVGQVFKLAIEKFGRQNFAYFTIGRPLPRC